MASQREGSLLSSSGSLAGLIVSMTCVEVSIERISDCIKKGRMINYSPPATKHKKYDHGLSLFSPGGKQTNVWLFPQILCHSEKYFFQAIFIFINMTF